MTVTWQDEDAASHFLDNRRHMPCMDLLFEAAVTLVGDIGRTPRRIVDLGCGEGATGGTMLRLWPQAELVLLDNSPPMLARARQRYGDQPNVRIVDADLGQAGLIGEVVKEPADAIVSSAAIHHLRRDRQRELYAEIFEALAPGGVFVNIEHVASAGPRTERLWWDWFYRKIAENRKKAGVPTTLQQVRAEFDPRQEVNILTPVEQQVQWLRQIGYVDADCVMKVYEMAVFGGYRPG